MSESPPRCKDCRAEGITTSRRAPNPGPRCATHWRKEKARRKAQAHENRVQDVYGLPPGGYDTLYRFQGGWCAICQRANGRTKKLAVDHNHRSGKARGLLCGPCNKAIGFARDDIDFFARAIEYLRNPPAKQLGIVAIHEENREREQG